MISLAGSRVGAVTPLCTSQVSALPLGAPLRPFHSPTMFQRLTSLFFSTPPPPEDPGCPRAFVSEEDEVDGWLIIDLPGEAWVGGPGL